MGELPSGGVRSPNILKKIKISFGDKFVIIMLSIMVAAGAVYNKSSVLSIFVESTEPKLTQGY